MIDQMPTTVAECKAELSARVAMRRRAEAASALTEVADAEGDIERLIDRLSHLLNTQEHTC